MPPSPAAAPRVVIVEDDLEQAALVRRWLERDGSEVEHFDSGTAFMRGLSATLPDVVVLDFHLPGLNGLQTLERLRERFPELPVVMLTSETEVEIAVAAMRHGAYDYLRKPVDRTRLLTTIRNAVGHYRMAVRIHQLEHEVEGWTDRGIIGESDVMKQLFREMDRVGRTDVTVLIRGESGTGKELVARALHAASSRRDGSFVALNCAAIPGHLIESELFGYEKGAFTGATQRQTGKVEAANGGTLFLDEVAELGQDVQAKLLRVLQEGSFHRLGSVTEAHSDFRLVAATHRDLRAEVDAGRFREDLYFRLAVFELEVPPLRARSNDIALLAESFAHQYGQKHLGRPARLRADTLTALMQHTWPGNIRELQNAIQRAVVTAEDGELRPADLPAFRQAAAAPSALPGAGPSSTEAAAAGPTLNLQQLERWAIEEALRVTDSNLSEVSRLLGIGRTTLYRKLKEYGLR